MFRSLYSKIAAGLALLFLAVGLIFIWVTVFSTDMYQQEVNQKLNISLADQIVKERLLMTGGTVNQNALKEIFHMLMVINPGIEIYLLDKNGAILTFSAPKDSVKLDRIDMAPVKQWLYGSRTAPVQGDDPKSTTTKKVFSAAPIVQDGKLQGYLYVILGGEQYDSVVQKIKGSYILQLSVWMIVAGVLFALVTGLLVFAMLTGRLRQLARVMDAFKQGEGFAPGSDSDKGPVSSSDEIDRLSQTFKQMAQRIEQQMEQLKASDQMRRQLVANVSHDLRTPLATLQGYMETLLIKENQHSPQQRRQYLETAIKHCHRLNKLVGELLEIARLESARMKLNPEAFDVRELVSDVVQKFELRAKEKHIELELNIPAALPFAMADIALVERALENLIENAIGYTPENGNISIDLSYDRDVAITICDTGPGIPKQERELIFKRFYHSDRGETGSKGHSGLGLAITKKIVELHGKQVLVTGRPGGGSCFCICFPAVTVQ